MRVWQFDVANSPILTALFEIVRAPGRPGGLVAAGDVAADLRGAPPAEDRDYHVAPKRFHRLENVARLVRLLPAPWKLQPRCAAHYPANAGVGWHTHTSSPGWRIYVPYPLVPEPRSGMLTTDGNIIDVMGFASVFRITADWRNCWHAVTAPTPRNALGVQVPDAVMAEHFPQLAG